MKIKEPKKIIKGGYYYIRVNGEQIAEHRHIMEVFIGRKLNSEEQVHHINGDKLDNRIENLTVVGKTEHNLLHTVQRSTKLPVDNFEVVPNYRSIMCICNKCGKKFKRGYYDMIGKKKLYCSRECAGVEKNGHINKCLNCNDIFYTSKSANKKYCSRECYLQHMKKTSEKTFVFRCPICGKKFKRFESKTSKGKNYCSKECFLSTINLDHFKQSP